MQILTNLTIGYAAIRQLSSDTIASRSKFAAGSQYVRNTRNQDCRKDILSTPTSLRPSRRSQTYDFHR